MDLKRAGDPGKSLTDARACLELHIEQGPVLEQLGLPLGAVLGTYGTQRHEIRFTGESGHAGGTPMEVRRDSLQAAARLVGEVRDMLVKPDDRSFLDDPADVRPGAHSGDGRQALVACGVTPTRTP